VILADLWSSPLPSLADLWKPAAHKFFLSLYKFNLSHVCCFVWIVADLLINYVCF